MTRRWAVRRCAARPCFAARPDPYLSRPYPPPPSSLCGAQVLLEFVGRDATGAFVGVGHSMAAQRMLARFQVGVLHPKDVIRIGAPF
jgi:hypothetical protein